MLKIINIMPYICGTHYSIFILYNNGELCTERYINKEEFLRNYKDLMKDFYSVN